MPTQARRLEFGWILEDNRYICDGCNVQEPHEHRCHHGDGAWKDGRNCECVECNPVLSPNQDGSKNSDTQPQVNQPGA